MDGNGKILSSARRDGEMESEAEEIEELEELEENNGWELILGLILGLMLGLILGLISAGTRPCASRLRHKY